MLEPLRVKHAEELAPVLDDVALHGFTGGEPAGVEELQLRFQRQVRGQSPDGRERWLNWAVRQRATGGLLGMVQATLKTGEPEAVAELAWLIGTPHQTQGYAKEAVGLTAKWLLEQRVHCLRAHIHPRHEASMALARSIGLMPTQTVVNGEHRWQSSEARWLHQVQTSSRHLD